MIMSLIVSVSWGSKYCHKILAGLEFSQGDVDGDTMFAFSYHVVQDSGSLEGTFSYLNKHTFFSDSVEDPTYL